MGRGVISAHKKERVSKIERAERWESVCVCVCGWLGGYNVLGDQSAEKKK